MGCGTCFKCREGTGCIRSISFSAEAMPNRFPEVVSINRTDGRWHKDMPAYRRLRLNGIQPPRIDDCAILEQRATEQFEVEMGKLVPENRKDQVREGLAIAQEMELQVARPKSVQVP